MREMREEAEAQEMVADRVWEECGWLRGRVRMLEGGVERGGVEGRRWREEVGEWKGRAEMAEGVLRVLGGEDGDGDGDGEEEVFMDCE